MFMRTKIGVNLWCRRKKTVLGQKKLGFYAFVSIKDVFLRDIINEKTKNYEGIGRKNRSFVC